jgi:hypothetical protein
MAYVSEEDMIVGRQRSTLALNQAIVKAMRPQLEAQLDMFRLIRFRQVNASIMPEQTFTISKSEFRLPTSFQDGEMQTASDND